MKNIGHWNQNLINQLDDGKATREEIISDMKCGTKEIAQNETQLSKEKCMLWKEMKRHEIQNEKVQHTFNRDSKRESKGNLEMGIFKGSWL